MTSGPRSVVHLDLVVECGTHRTAVNLADRRAALDVPVAIGPAGHNRITDLQALFETHLGFEVLDAA